MTPIGGPFSTILRCFTSVEWMQYCATKNRLGFCKWGCVCLASTSTYPASPPLVPPPLLLDVVNGTELHLTLPVQPPGCTTKSYATSRRLERNTRGYQPKEPASLR